MKIAFYKRGKSCWQAAQRKIVELWDVTLYSLAPTLQNILLPSSSGFCTVIVVPGSITSLTQLGGGGANAPPIYFYQRIVSFGHWVGDTNKTTGMRVGERCVYILRTGSNQTSPHFWTEASRCAHKRNKILNYVRHHNYFITQGNYMGYMFRLLISHLQVYFVNCPIDGIPMCA